MKSVDMKECFKKHPTLHLVTGVGVGLVLVALFPGLVPSALMLGVIAIVVGVGAELLTGQT